MKLSKSIKAGFTLVELMVFFLVITLILAASTPIITKKIKGLPLKINHGKYICYRSEAGGYVQEYYNASQRVSPPEYVAACSFKPSKSAALYKIELIGAGSGGYQYYKVSDDTDEKTASWSYKTGTTGSRYADPTDNQLRDLLNGADFVLAQYTGKGGDGASLKYTYLPLTNTYCALNVPNEVYYGGRNGNGVPSYYNSGGPLLYNNDDLGVAQRTGIMQDEIRIDGVLRDEPRTYVSEHKSKLDNICVSFGLYLADAHGVIDNAFSFIQRNDPKTKVGGKGGAGKYLVLDYKINIPADTTGVSNYLKELFTYDFKKGSCTQKGCKGSSFYSSAPKSGSSVSSRYLNIGTDSQEIGVWLPKDVTYGKDVERYAAIKLKDGAYVTNEIKATGGKSAQLYITPYDGKITFNIDDNKEDVNGEEADGIYYSKTSQYSPYVYITPNATYDKIPGVKINTKLNVRQHTVGKAGQAGKHKVVYASDLGPDCTFSIPKGGKVIDSATNMDLLPEIGKTTLTCKDQVYTADSGEYSKATRLEEYNTFDYVNNGKVNVPAEFKTEPEAGPKSDVNKIGNIFTKYTIPVLQTLGTGGGGTGLIDKCTQPYGEAIMSTVYDTQVAKSIRYVYPKANCDSEVNQVPIDATEGGSGAIIISW